MSLHGHSGKVCVCKFFFFHGMSFHSTAHDDAVGFQWRLSYLSDVTRRHVVVRCGCVHCSTTKRRAARVLAGLQLLLVSGARHCPRGPSRSHCISLLKAAFQKQVHDKKPLLMTPSVSLLLRLECSDVVRQNSFAHIEQQLRTRHVPPDVADVSCSRRCGRWEENIRRNPEEPWTNLRHT